MMRSQDDFCVVAAVNNREILASCLARSPDIASGHLKLDIYEGYSSAASALNAGLGQSRAEIVIFAHQDVYLPRDWLLRLREQIEVMERHSPEWGVLGVFGRTEQGRDVGRVWCSAQRRELGAGGFPPTEIVTLDELLLVVRRNSGLSFDDQAPHFHLYGTDIVLESRRAGLPAFVVDAPVIHNTKIVRTLAGPYTDAYRYMRRKWWDSLPAITMICSLTRSPVPLWRAKFRRFRALRSHTPQPPLDAVQLAKALKYE